MYSISIYSTLGFCLVSYLFSEAALLSRILDRADKLLGHDAFLPVVLHLAISSEPYAPMKHLTYTWTSGTQNGTILSSPPSTNAEKGTAKGTATDERDLQTEKVKTGEPPECGDEEEQFYGDDCGGGEWDELAEELRCKGITEDNYLWKDCFCIERGHRMHLYQPPDSPSSEEIAATFRDLPDFTDDSFSLSPPGWAEEQSELERQLKNDSATK